MSGQIIPFQGRKPVLPRGLSGAATVERQVARIADLIEELEILTRNTLSLAPGVIERARATMNQARALVGGLEGAGTAEDLDPQPEVDRELLARLYREVNPTKSK